MKEERGKQEPAYLPHLASLGVCKRKWLERREKQFRSQFRSAELPFRSSWRLVTFTHKL